MKLRSRFQAIAAWLIFGLLAARRGRAGSAASFRKMKAKAFLALVVLGCAGAGSGRGELAGYGDHGGNIADWELKGLIEGIKSANMRLREFAARP